MIQLFALAILLITFSCPVFAHISTGMVGFTDGLSHPVLGADHFLAMVSVGVVSAQIGGRAMWYVPATFVLFMIIGGVIGMTVETSHSLQTVASSNSFPDFVTQIIELGIVFSVIFLGLAITIERKLSTKITMTFVAVFGVFHGLAHGLEMPWASNPVLFATGFASGTATLHLFGVGIGLILNKRKFSAIILRIMGAGCVMFGFYLLFQSVY